MRNPDYRDVLGGGALILIGVYATFHAVTTLRLGQLTQMGPGMFPAALGCILAAIGFAIMVPAFFRAGEAPRVDLRSFAAVMLSILAFAILVEPFGMVPAIVVLTAISSRADSKLSLTALVVLAAALAAGSILIFEIGLGMPIRAFAWPW